MTKDFCQDFSPMECVVSSWALPWSDVSGWFFCSHCSWFEPQVPSRVAGVRITARWKAERCCRAQQGSSQPRWFQEGAAVSHGSGRVQRLWSSQLHGPGLLMPLTQALKPRCFCLMLILCTYSEREVKIKQFQHRTQDLTFRKMSHKNKQRNKQCKVWPQFSSLVF